MIRILLAKIKEALVSVLPVSLIVLALELFSPFFVLSNTELIVFSISSVFLVIGIGLFNLGADMAMTPMGMQVGAGLSRSRRVSVLMLVCFALGVLITVAEPDLSVLAKQVSEAIAERHL